MRKIKLLLQELQKQEDFRSAFFTLIILFAIPLPLVLFLARVFHISTGWAFMNDILLSFVFYIVRHFLVKWVEEIQDPAIRKVSMLVIGYHLALVALFLVPALGLTHGMHLQKASYLISCYEFLALWSLWGGLRTRNERGMYVALHLTNLLFWMGIIIVMLAEGQISTFHVVFVFPLAIALLLLLCMKPILWLLAFLFRRFRRREKPQSRYTPPYSKRGLPGRRLR